MFSVNMEFEYDQGHCEVVQSDQRVRIYSTGGWWERRVRSHLSREKAGLNTLNEGQSVEYDEVPNKGKTSAENLKVAR